MYHYLLTFQLDPASAQDVTQEVFLRLYSVWKKEEQIRNPRAWVFKVAHNLGLTTRKRSARWEPMEESAYPAGAAHPECQALDKERAKLIEEALHELSAQQRQVLHLRAEGLKYREIADAIGVRVSTVSVFLTRAVKRLRKAIE
ncbi:MAG: RNA polymerase sigma factor [Bryobacterales bacterium]|nr:RNA polymerase sigma factor [Bryobacterales bacterium]